VEVPYGGEDEGEEDEDAHDGASKSTLAHTPRRAAGRAAVGDALGGRTDIAISNRRSMR
jgi:hypothetical protein